MRCTRRPTLRVAVGAARSDRTDDVRSGIVRRRGIAPVAAAAGTVFALVASLRAHAATTCDAAEITWPADGQTVVGRAGVFGSAAMDGFQFYKVEFASARAPEDWSAASDVVRTPARHARLDTWSTVDVPDGAYRLKLTVVDTTAQERCRRVVENVVVANGRGTYDAAKTAPARTVRLPAAPWPTAVVGRALVQPPAPITPAAAAAMTTTAATGSAVVTTTRAVTGSAATDTVTTTGTSAEPGAAANAAVPPGLVGRFGMSFAVGFVVVAALLALLARRASRARPRPDDGTA